MYTYMTCINTHLYVHICFTVLFGNSHASMLSSVPRVSGAELRLEGACSLLGLVNPHLEIQIARGSMDSADI